MFTIKVVECVCAGKFLKNRCKVLVYSCLWAVTAFSALRLDGSIAWSWWAVFWPLWLWKGLVLLGAAVGTYVWCRHPHYRLENEAYVHFKAMLISLALHLILLMFELLVCDQLNSERHLWILVFIPLIFISIVSIAVCIWALKHDRTFELELFCAVNILQFIFLALKLDGFILWTWEVVFVPFWILMCLCLVGVLYCIIFAGILLWAPEVNIHQRRTSFNSALAYTFLVIPILVFQVLLANKLDEGLSLPYIVVVSPLFISFATLILMAFNSKGGNKWWFGMRKDFCQFLLSVFPLLQEYANIAYNNDNSNSNSTSSRRGNSMIAETQQNNPPVEQYRDRRSRSKDKHCKKSGKEQKKNELLKPVVPIISIDIPD